MRKCATQAGNIPQPPDLGRKAAQAPAEPGLRPTEAPLAQLTQKEVALQFGAG